MNKQEHIEMVEDILHENLEKDLLVLGLIDDIILDTGDITHSLSDILDHIGGIDE